MNSAMMRILGLGVSQVSSLKAYHKARPVPNRHKTGLVAGNSSVCFASSLWCLNTFNQNLEHVINSSAQKW